MSRIKTYILLCPLALFCATPVAAHPTLPHLFAGCVGRLSAELEHAWLMNDAAAPRYEGQRDTFMTMLEAIEPEAGRSSLLSYRIETKVAQTSLLNIADFSLDVQRAKRAREQARRHLRACEQLLLGA